MRCAAVKKKGSIDQCAAFSMKGHTLCGKHARAKNVVLWTQTDRHLRSITQIQAVVRGWFVRRLLSVAGPGVLRRTNLANDEELVSYQSKDRQSPLDYFAFEEAGKVWWFSHDSLRIWASKSLEPLNPYTRTALSSDTRKRLREMSALRMYRSMPSTDETSLECRWNVVCQIFIDHGFAEVHPGHFANFTKSDFVAMFRLILESVPAASEAATLSKTMLRTPICLLASAVYISASVRMFQRILSTKKDPYSLCFIILSAIYRA